ncbi:MAG TPA: hypothetical protein VKQ36_06610 [Ktedonobacterales bacterium]|nr:hypothetical protein [Ktedonobacterales bacterium]
MPKPKPPSPSAFRAGASGGAPSGSLDGSVLQGYIQLSQSGTSSGTWNTNSPQAHWQQQTDTGVDLSQGDLTYSYPLDIPSGPGGFTVPLTLSYSSGSVTSQHNPQAAAGWARAGISAAWARSPGASTTSRPVAPFRPARRCVICQTSIVRQHEWNHHGDGVSAGRGRREQRRRHHQVPGRGGPALGGARRVNALLPGQRRPQ